MPFPAGTDARQESFQVVDLRPFASRFPQRERNPQTAKPPRPLPAPSGKVKCPPGPRRSERDPNLPTIEVTADAARKARQLLAASPAPASALRVRVIDGGCSGMRYELLFDAEVRDDDEQSEQHGLRVLVDAESATYLEGTSVHYSDALNDAGFKIENPRAETTCGCGESFNVV